MAVGIKTNFVSRIYRWELQNHITIYRLKTTEIKPVHCQDGDEPVEYFLCDYEAYAWAKDSDIITKK